MKAYAQSKWGKELVKEEVSIRGWNYGKTDVDGKPAYGMLKRAQTA